MELHFSRKLFEAEKIQYIEFHLVDKTAALCFYSGISLRHVSEKYLREHKPKVDGYYVREVSGEESWEPAEAFEQGYTPALGVFTQGSVPTEQGRRYIDGIRKEMKAMKQEKENG